MNNISTLYTTVLFICLSSTLSLAQQLDHRLGEFIVQFNDHYDVRQAYKELKEITKNGISFQVERALVADLGIFLLSVDFREVNEIEMLRYLRKQKFIKYAQFNHLLEYRKTPDDPQFDLQWQYINNGGNGGTIGADLDADLAWDITTGGLSPNGDSIVVCVIDEGFDIEHSDLKPNHWLNRAEIPDNDIDDDNNGYVDDYYGWNAYLDNDNMGSLKGHGTPVAGIVGAKGNNGIGVAGVNWDVKLMLVVGGGQEAEALAAYAYPYAARKRYNETGGKEGAFVVATNASWGIPALRESDAPIWCEFYNTLGEEGILNTAATENRNIDVDKDGDLPANCSSEFLIAVTNLDRTGEKLSSAGFGATHIDLGAFGAQTYTISPSNGYSSFGGTSAATPHVAGTIGLIYSAPCPALGSLALNDPESAALLARRYLLEGVVPTQSLDGITTTGGRLNMNNSLQLVMQECDPCPAPTLINATNITDQAITLEWIETDSILSVDLFWRTQGSNEWNVEKNVSTPYQLNNLITCQNYELQLQSFCNADTSDLSRILLIETDGCCRPPAELNISDKKDTSVKLDWPSVLAAQSYNLRYRETGSSDWNETNTTDVSILLDKLISCTNYEGQVQTVCDTGATNFGPLLDFSTSGCGACLDLDYCISKGGDSSDEWIQQVSIDDWSNDSGNNGGFGDFTGLDGPTLTANETYQLVLVPGYGSQNWNEYFKVWIDFNQDGVFDEGTEEIYNIDDAINQADTLNFSIPAFAKSGLTRMRVSMEFVGFTNNNEPEPCDDAIEFGEVEDYCVTIEGLPCPAVAELNGSLITPTAATISWEEVSTDFEYQLEYKIIGETDWQMVSLDTNEYRIPGLLQCNSYEARVLTTCGDQSGGYSPLFNFNTTCPCFTPVGLDTISVTNQSIQLLWSEANNADAYAVRFRKMGENDWTQLSSENDDLKLTIDDLSTCTEYEVQIQSQCLGNNSLFSQSVVIKTDCSVSTFDVEAFAKLKVFPNPFHRQLTIDLQLLEASEVQLSLWNIQGQLLKQEAIGHLPKGEHQLSFSWQALAGGVYFIQLETEQDRAIKRVVKSGL